MPDLGARGRWLERLARTLELQDRAHARLLPMEGLRGLAVALVFLQHYSYQSLALAHFSGVGHTVMAALRAYGNQGVELFFVLSGYLIYGALVRRRQSFWPFMARRVRRIHPAFLVAFGIFLLLHLAAPGDDKLPPDPWSAASLIVANLLLLPGLFPIRPVMDVSWSLSYEMFFYGATATVVAALGLHDLSSGRRLALIAAGAVLFLVACSLLPWMPLRMLPFFAGMALAEGVGTTRGRVPSIVGLAAPVVSLVISRSLPDLPPLLIESVHTLAFLALCAACFSGGVAGRAFAWTPIRWLGNMSYSYYLLHGLTLIPLSFAAHRLLGDDLPPLALWIALVPVFALSLVPAFVLFALVERPVSLRPSTARRPVPA